MTVQQSLPFFQAFDYSFESYIAVEGQKWAYQALKSWETWVDPICVIQGPSFSGKTHLAHIWQQWSGAVFHDLKQTLNHKKPIIIDELIPADLTEDLFHFLNKIREEKRPTLFLCQTPPYYWPAPFPDLSSRLKALVTVVITPPSEHEQRDILAKMMADAQIKVSKTRRHRLLLHCPRSYEGLKHLWQSLCTGRV